MYQAVFTPIDVDSLDNEAALIYDRRGRLVAIVVRLADPAHGQDVGRWNVETYFPCLGQQFPLFNSLDAVIRALRTAVSTQHGRLVGPDHAPITFERTSHDTLTEGAAGAPASTMTAPAAPIAPSTVMTVGEPLRDATQSLPAKAADNPEWVPRQRAQR